VGVVVNHRDAARPADHLQAALDPAELFKRRGHLAQVKAKALAKLHAVEGVFGIVPAHEGQPETRAAVIKRDASGGNPGLEARLRDAGCFQGIAADHALLYLAGEGRKNPLHFLQLEMILGNVGYDGQVRVKMQQRPVAFVKLQHPRAGTAETEVARMAVAHPVQHRRAVDHGRIEPELGQHPADHAGDGGFAGRAGDGDAPPAARKLRKHRGAVDHGDAERSRGRDIRVVLLDGGADHDRGGAGADSAAILRNQLHSQGAQLAEYIQLAAAIEIAVGPGDRAPEGKHELREGAHPHPAGADKVIVHLNKSEIRISNSETILNDLNLK